MNSCTPSSRGFTILELLVVVGIIALLSGLVLASLTSTRARGRDVHRLENIRGIEKALNLYYADNNIFPIANTTLDGADAVSTALVSGDHLSSMPLDPREPTYTYGYSGTTGSDYSLSFCLETETIQGFNQGCGNSISQ